VVITELEHTDMWKRKFKFWIFCDRSAPTFHHVFFGSVKGV